MASGCPRTGSRCPALPHFFHTQVMLPSERGHCPGGSIAADQTTAPSLRTPGNLEASGESALLCTIVWAPAGLHGREATRQLAQLPPNPAA